MPMARAPIGIFMNSPAYFVAEAGPAVASSSVRAALAAHVQTRRVIRRLGEPQPGIATRYVPRESTVNRPRVGLPLRHRGLAGGRNDPPLASDPPELTRGHEAL